MRALRRGSASSGDEGFAAVVVLALSGVLVLIAGVLVALGAVAVTRTRAASAADQGALAAAGRVWQGPAVACAAAARVVTAVGARLSGCDLLGEVVDVEVDLPPAGPLGELGIAHAHARAGPVTLPG